MSELLRVENLSKSYGSIQAVAGIDLAIEEGICFGLLGPNGAGKTTAIELMEGIQKPDAGTVYFRGKPTDRHFKQKVGIQFQSTALPEFITVKETLQLFSSFYPNPRPLDQVVEMCSLADILGQDNRKLSGGQRQRMLLGIAVIPKPELVFLDEPTTGLDPQARRNFWELVRKIKAEGTTILLTTHYMDEAQVLCDKIGIMDSGKILEIDSPDALLRKHFDGTLVRLPYQGQNIPEVHGSSELRGDLLEIQTTSLDKTLQALMAANINLQGLAVLRPTLEDLFIKLTGSSLRS